MIYVDILLLTNFTFDLLSLYIVAGLTSCRVKLCSCMIGAVIGSLASVWLLLYCSGGLLFWAVFLATTALTVCLSLFPKGISSFIRMTVLYLTVLFLLGAGAYYVLDGMMRHFGIIKADPSSAKTLLFWCISLLIAGGMELSSFLWKRQLVRKNTVLEIIVQNRAEKVPCLFDSGCLVREPISGEPVVFIPYRYAQRLVGEEDLALIENGDLANADSLSDPIKHIVRLVPYRTVSGGSMLMCIRSTVVIGGIRKRAWMAVLANQDGQKEGICPASLAG